MLHSGGNPKSKLLLFYWEEEDRKMTPLTTTKKVEHMSTKYAIGKEIEGILTKNNWYNEASFSRDRGTIPSMQSVFHTRNVFQNHMQDTKRFVNNHRLLNKKMSF